MMTAETKRLTTLTGCAWHVSNLQQESVSNGNTTGVAAGSRVEGKRSGD